MNLVESHYYLSVVSVRACVRACDLAHARGRVGMCELLSFAAMSCGRRIKCTSNLHQPFLRVLRSSLYHSRSCWARV